ncbi:LysR family transcriptional regulator [Nitrospirillum sp. BR 11164]|uniref:LysR family transcriptional regulator n=1 Tax=Nitrospirillum sp. BR 11164 TaxID=3104324 RepID=UPI002AFE1ECC|nr:LysR family transcriptional regulator [Nitrospirillum sp. BR 11164]MEA1652056.1 LysR family transcriptional regulator [Nitrospirillum sp. BR 11164]
MDRLDELSLFLAILETGSLAAAGRRLRRSAPAVTRTLAALEARVGTRLVERTTRQLAPTEAGRRLAETARRVLADYDEAMREGNEAAPRGLLRVTAPLVFGRRHVTPVVTSFLAAYPLVRVELLLSDRQLDLIEDGLDVALRIGDLPDSGLVARRVGQVRQVTVAAPGYLAHRGTPQRPEDLGTHDTIVSTPLVHAPQAGPAEWRFLAPGGDRGRERTVPLSPRLMVNEVEAKLEAVRAGHGIGQALSYQVVDDLAAGRLVRLLTAFERPPLPVHLVVPSTVHLAAKARAFLDHAAPLLKALDVLREPA